MESSLVTFLPIGLAGFEKADYSVGELLLGRCWSPGGRNGILSVLFLEESTQ